MNMLSLVAAAPALALSAPATASEAINPDDGQDAYENGLEVARMDFALAWLAQWTSSGGSVTLDGERAWIGKATFSLSRDGAAFAAREAELTQQDWWKVLPADEQERLARERRSYASACYDGKMRALDDLLDSVDEARRTVKELVRLAPSIGLSQAEG
jgi:hypothetical protein